MFTGLFGTLEGTRTPDLLVRSQSLYPAELPAHTNKIYQLIQLLTKCPQVDLVFRSQSLYPAELPAHMQVFFTCANYYNTLHNKKQVFFYKITNYFCELSAINFSSISADIFTSSPHGRFL